METITLLAIQTGLLFIISLYLLYRLRNRLINKIESTNYDLNEHIQLTKHEFKKIGNIVYRELYDKNETIYFKSQGKEIKAKILYRINSGLCEPIYKVVDENNMPHEIFQNEITAWE